jgi:hypothetical protein
MLGTTITGSRACTNGTQCRVDGARRWHIGVLMHALQGAGVLGLPEAPK